MGQGGPGRRLDASVKFFAPMCMAALLIGSAVFFGVSTGCFRPAKAFKPLLADYGRCGTNPSCSSASGEPATPRGEATRFGKEQDDHVLVRCAAAPRWVHRDDTGRAPRHLRDGGQVSSKELG